MEAAAQTKTYQVVERYDNIASGVERMEKAKLNAKRNVRLLARLRTHRSRRTEIACAASAATPKSRLPLKGRKPGNGNTGCAVVPKPLRRRLKLQLGNRETGPNSRGWVVSDCGAEMRMLPQGEAALPAKASCRCASATLRAKGLSSRANHGSKNSGSFGALSACYLRDLKDGVRNTKFGELNRAFSFLKYSCADLERVEHDQVAGWSGQQAAPTTTNPLKSWHLFAIALLCYCWARLLLCLMSSP